MLTRSPINSMFSMGEVCGRRGGLVVTALVYGSSGRGHCVAFLGKTLYFSVPLSTQVYKWVPANLMLRLTLAAAMN